MEDFSSLLATLEDWGGLLSLGKLQELGFTLSEIEAAEEAGKVAIEGHNYLASVYPLAEGMQ